MFWNCARFGAGSGSHYWVVPPFCLRISFNLFFFACKRKLPFSIILRRSAAASSGRAQRIRYLLYLQYLSIFLWLWVVVKKARIIKGFGVFAPVFSSCFGTQLLHVQYTIIARVVYNYCTFGTQKSHALLWLYIYAYNAFTVFGYCVAFYKSFGFPIIKYGRRIFPYASFFGFGGV